MSQTELEKAYAAVANAERKALAKCHEQLNHTIETLSAELEKLPVIGAPTTTAYQTLHNTLARIRSEAQQFENTLTMYAVVEDLAQPKA